MPTFWSSSLEFGIPEIDDEHREFLALCESLETLVRSQASASEISMLSVRICDHSMRHFSNEEGHLRGSGYDQAHAVDFAAHVDEHRRLVQVIDENQIWLTGDSDKAISVALGIKASLLEHLLRWDLRYAEYLRRNRGLGPRNRYE
jgi:hemerythrin